VRRPLLICGIASSVVYLIANVAAAFAWPAYRSALQTISEVSALGAPSEPVWIPLGFAYSALLVVFGVGVWRHARSRGLQITGFALIAIGLLGPLWPPIHQRGEPTSLTDTLHLAFAGITTILIFIAVISGMSAFGRKFRVYSIATLVVLFASGVVTFVQTGNLATGAPTPWLGVVERIDLGAYLLWVAVLSGTLLRHDDCNDEDHVDATDLAIHDKPTLDDPARRSSRYRGRHDAHA